LDYICNWFVICYCSVVPVIVQQGPKSTLRTLFYSQLLLTWDIFQCKDFSATYFLSWWLPCFCGSLWCFCQCSSI